MTSMAVTASMCASASEVALLVASFMPVLSLNLGATDRGAKMRKGRRISSLGTPRAAYSPDKVPMQRIATVSTSISIEAAI